MLRPRIMAQKLSQVPGVGQVNVGGSALPGVRVELNPQQLNKYGIGMEQVRTVLAAANTNTPKGHLTNGLQMWEIGSNDQIFTAKDYASLIVSYNNNNPVRLSDVGQVVDSVEDLRNAGYANGKPSVLVIINKQPNANIIDTVDRINALLPQLKAAMPHAIDYKIMMDQTVTIRASVFDVEKSLIISIILVVLVVFFFLRSVRSTFIPSVVVPLSLIGTFGVMYLLGYSLDNLSLMALTISTGFVVDDAIVVIENISRYLEMGMNPFHAALKGASEIGSTVLTISISLVAVFIPLLLMGGIVGRLFREFAVTLSVAIAVSMALSLTATPMMCAHLLKQHGEHGWFYRTSERHFNNVMNAYGRALHVVLRHSFITLMVLFCTIALNVFLYIRVPKGFFPQQDNGRLSGSIVADQDTSFQAMNEMLQELVNIVAADPAVDAVNGFCGGQGGFGGGGSNTGRMFANLKPRAERAISADQVIARLRPKLARVPGVTLYLQANQDIRIGGRQSAAQYQYTMRGDNVDDLQVYAPQMLEALKKIPVIADLNSDLQDKGLQSMVVYDRSQAARFGISPQLIDNTLYDAFGQRQVSTMYQPLNQYHVVMEAAPQYWQNPEILRDIYVHGPNGQTVPLSAIAHWASNTAALSIAHQGLFPAVTLSFNLLPGVALGDATTAIDAAAREVGLPPTIQTGYAGTAQAYKDSLDNEPILIAAALVTVYLVLGILYESYIHPITILSTLPSAGVGAFLALMIYEDGTHGDRDDRDHPADRAGEEERNHDGGFRIAVREAGRQIAARCYFRGLFAAVPPHYDDYDGGYAGRRAVGHRQRNGFGAAAAAGYHDHRRAVDEPDADAVYDACGLLVFRSFAALVEPGTASPTENGAKFRGMMETRKRSADGFVCEADFGLRPGLRPCRSAFADCRRTAVFPRVHGGSELQAARRAGAACLQRTGPARLQGSQWMEARTAWRQPAERQVVGDL